MEVPMDIDTPTSCNNSVQKARVELANRRLPTPSEDFQVLVSFKDLVLDENESNRFDSSTLADSDSGIDSSLNSDELTFIPIVLTPEEKKARNKARKIKQKLNIALSNEGRAQLGLPPVKLAKYVRRREYSNLKRLQKQAKKPLF